MHSTADLDQHNLQWFYATHTPKSGLLETIDMIRAIRAEADADEREDTYDPCGHTRARCALMRAHADKIEADMEARLGWKR